MTTQFHSYQERLTDYIALFSLNNDNQTANVVDQNTKEHESLGNYSEQTNPFLLKLCEIVHQNITDADFDVARCADLMEIHRSTLYLNVKKQLGVSPNLYIQLCRLTIAKHSLPTHKGTLSQLAFDVGFDSLNYFTRCFKRHFNMRPRELLQRP